MCKKTFFLISLLLVLGLVGSTMATTWYVDNAVASSGNGQSWATAFKNFSDIGWGSVAAGDFIYISGGSSGGTKTYTESWSVGASGTSGNPITIAIDAANSSHNGTAVFDYNAHGDYATVEGIFLSDRSYITISGNVNGENHIAIKNLRNISERSAASCIVGWSNTAITIDHIDVTNCNNGIRLWSGTAGTGYEVMYSNFTQIRGDVAVMVSVSENSWDQVKIHDNYIEILYNSAVPPGESGNYGGADGFQTCSGTSIYRNTCKVTNTSSVYTSTQHPDMIQAQGNYLKVYDNDFIDLGDSAFDYDCYGNSTPHDVRIYNNLYRLVNSSDPYPEFFRLYISNSNALTSINNFKILNNTYVDASGYYTIRFNGFKTNNPTGSGNEIKNNIFYNCNGGSQYEMIRIDSSTGFTDSSFSFDGNIYYNSSQSNYIYYNGTAYTAADWIAAREPNGTTSAPTFVSYSSKNINNNLHLASTDNVAKDTGVSLGSYFTTDKDGITRPQGSAWDIGAYEYIIPPLGDFTGDHVVDFEDLKILTDDWLVTDYVLTGLVSRYKFDGDATDSVGGNNGTEVGGPTYNPGFHSQAIDLDGNDDYVDCGNDSSFNITDSITLSALIKGTFNNGWDPIIAKGYDWMLSRGIGDEATFFCIGVGSVIGSTSINDNQWHHVAGVYNGSKMDLYVDGQLDASKSASGSLNVSAVNVYIGGSATQSFNGLIDDVRIYDRALSADEIRTLYFGPATDLVNDYNIDFRDFAVLANNWLVGI